MTENQKKQRGRPKGKVGQATMRRRALVERVEKSLKSKGRTPLEIFAAVMGGDLSITEMQFEAAKAAAPYIHPKLSSVEMNATVRRRIEDMSDDELEALANSGDSAEES
ncbi:hypothetical protein [Acetobacter sp. DsW_059]|nr:hypothetical protein [Acetobacter sp. DsW_059]